MQSKARSLKETISQSLVGMMIGFIAMRFMLSNFESLDKNTQSVIIVLVMFILSTLRGYVIRRYFNKKDLE